ncbi:MAG: lactonase family protein [Thermoplasmata archaeon]|nr:lactonase family protein [Thermoplasmata archaeon]
MTGASRASLAMKPPSVHVWLTLSALFLLIVPTVALARSPPLVGPAPASSGTAWGSAVFTMTNNASGNSVVAYRIGHAGALIRAGTFATHGAGSGSSLADQGALALTANDRWLLVVDDGSNQISVFRVHAPTSSGPLLTFMDRAASGGVRPVSLAIHGSLVYVLNVGNATVAGDIAGFWLSSSGHLAALPGSHRPLSSPNATGAAQVSFSPGGQALVVTEKATSLLDTYAVGSRGYATGPTTTPSNGSTPYGFAFTPNGHLVVSDAGPGALSSYAVSGTAGVSVISGTVPDHQSAACWVAIAEGGRFAYTSNAHNASISTYQVSLNGTLILQASVGGTTGSGPTDLAVTTSNGNYLLAYASAAGEIDEFALAAHGALVKTASVYGLPSTAEGLVAF